MPFIKEDLSDVTESKPVPEGEYDLKCVKAEEKKSKKGADMMEVTIVIDDSDYPNASPIKHWFMSPDGADPEIAHLRKLEWKRFCEMFGLEYDCEADDIPGETGKCFVYQEEGDDGNMYNRLRLPRLKE